MIAPQGSLDAGNVRPLSSLPRAIREVEHAFIPFADGARLACRYRLPVDAEERPVPAILEYIYTSIDRRAATKDAFRLLDDLVASVFPITQADVHAAREIAEGHVLLSAPDYLHLAVMRAKGVESALTFDQGFSAFPGITILP